MYFEEHNPPHIHVNTSDGDASVDIKTGKILEGEISKNKVNIVKLFVEAYRDELLDMWNTKTLHKIEK